MSQPEVSENKAEQVKFLTDRGWEEKHGLWTHPKRTYQGLPYMFNFDQAMHAELYRKDRPHER